MFFFFAQTNVRAGEQNSIKSNYKFRICTVFGSQDVKLTSVSVALCVSQATSYDFGHVST